MIKPTQIIGSLIVLSQFNVNLRLIEKEIKESICFPDNFQISLQEILIYLGFNFDIDFTKNTLKLHVPEFVIKNYLNSNDRNQENSNFHTLINYLTDKNMFESYSRISELLVAINCHDILCRVKVFAFTKNKF